MNNFEQLFLEYKAARKEETVVLREKATFVELIDFCIHKGQQADALWLSDDAIAQYPTVADFYFSKSALLIKNNQFDEGFVTLKKGRSLSPTSQKYFLIHFDLCIVRRDFQAAIDVLKAGEQVLEGKELVEIYLSKSIIYQKLNRLEFVFLALKKLLLLDPSHIVAHQRLFWIVEKLGFYEESIELNRHLITLDPYCAWAWYNLATALVAMEEPEFYEEAIDAYEYAFSIDPDFVRAYSECADLYFDMQNYEKALYYFERALETRAEDVGLLNRIAECYLEMDNTYYAERFFLQSFYIDTDNEETLYGIGRCCYILENWQGAWSAYRDAAALNPEDARFTHGLAIVLEKQNAYQEAYIYFRKTLDLEPETVKYWSDFVDFLIDNGNFERAHATLKESQLYHPADPKIDLYFLILMYESGQRAQALYHLHDLLTNEPHLKAWLFTVRPTWIVDKDILKVLNNSSR